MKWSKVYWRESSPAVDISRLMMNTMTMIVMGLWPGIYVYACLPMVDFNASSSRSHPSKFLVQVAEMALNNLYSLVKLLGAENDKYLTNYPRRYTGSLHTYLLLGRYDRNGKVPRNRICEGVMGVPATDGAHTSIIPVLTPTDGSTRIDGSARTPGQYSQMNVTMRE